VAGGRVPNLFISGVPATGKTTFSRWLASNMDYVRCPSGEEPGPNFRREIEAAIDSGAPVVVEMGFLEGGFDLVEDLTELGFEFWWFDGDREVALQNFLDRPNHPATPENFRFYMAHVERHWGRYQENFEDRRLDVISGPERVLMSNEDRWAAIQTYTTSAARSPLGCESGPIDRRERALLATGIIGSMPDSASDPLDVVRLGYDQLSARYRPDNADPKEYRVWTGELLTALQPGSSVLDLGCGCGVPVARRLVQEGHRVTGIDISERQIERARTLVPGAMFQVADMTRRILEPASFDAVIAFYSLIHVPLAAQPTVIEQVSNCLVDGGLLLATVGWEAWTGSDVDWLDSGVEMWWSQADQATYRIWLEEAGLEVVQCSFAPDGESGHALIWARRQRRM